MFNLEYQKKVLLWLSQCSESELEHFQEVFGQVSSAPTTLQIRLLRSQFLTMKTIIAEEMKTQRENVKHASEQAKHASEQAKHAGGTIKKKNTKTPNLANRDDAQKKEKESNQIKNCAGGLKVE